MAIPAYFFPSASASSSDVIDFGPFDNPCVGDTSLCFGATVHILSNPPSGNDARIICKQVGSSDTQHEFMLSLINTNALRVRLRAGGSTATIISANNLIPFDQTFRIASTYDGATIRAWINGVETTSGDFPAAKTGNLDAVAGSELWLGNGLPGSRNMQGYIAEGFGDIYWEPERLAAWGAGEPLENLLRRPFFWANGEQWAEQGRGRDQWIDNRTQVYPGVPHAGLVEQDVYSALMPGIDRRDFVQVIFPDFPVIDQGAGGIGLVHVIGETVEASEGSLRRLALARPAGETVEASEDLVPARALNRLFGETLQILEASIAARTLARSRAETVELGETTPRALGRAVAFGESVTIAEDLANVLGRVTVYGESVQIAEALATAIGIVKEVLETVAAAEALQVARALTRPQGEVLAIGEQLLGLRALARPVAETATVAEGAFASRAMTRAVAESVTIAEAVAQVVATAGGVAKIALTGLKPGAATLTGQAAANAGLTGQIAANIVLIGKRLGS